jgi:hypothetical protein
MHTGVGADCGVVFNGHMACKRCGIGHDDVASDLAIMRDVSRDHNEVIISNSRMTAATFCSPVDVDVFAEGVVGSDRQERLFAGKLEILRLNADHAKRKESIVVSDGCRAFNHDVGVQNTPVADGNVFSDAAERADGYIFAYFGETVNDGGVMNHELRPDDYG